MTEDWNIPIPEASAILEPARPDAVLGHPEAAFGVLLDFSKSEFFYPLGFCVYCHWGFVRTATEAGV